jgi:(p)ppGpp synthase/HD superfamily hydrolase
MKQQLALAINFASTKHLNQFDKAGMPYILHPITVMKYLNTEDQELMAIAVLHDVVEDCNVTFKELEDLGLSERIVAGVRGMTKIPGETVDDNLRRIMETPDVVKVKICDLRHNSELFRLKGIGSKDMERMQKYMYMYFVLTGKTTIYGERP